MRRLLIAVMAAGLTVAAPVAAQEPAAPVAPAPAADVATLFVITYRPGPAWRTGGPIHEQALGPHVAYVTQLMAQGRVHGGGPFVGSDGGMMILRAADRAEAEATAQADPAVTAGVFTHQIEQWTPLFRARTPLPAPAGF